VLLQQWDFANANFMSRIHDGLTSGARVIALISSDYLASAHCLAEALNTIGHDPLNKRQRLIPMRIAECTPDGLFTALAYWDLLPVRGNGASLRDIVLAAVSADRARQAPASTYWREPRPVLHPAISPVPNFTGRVENLAKIEAALWAERAEGEVPAHTAAITQAISGLGGIGKSVLGRQYGWENRERYAGVWSFAAETRPGITEGLIELGARFIRDLDKVEDKAAAARHALEFIAAAGFAKPWLLICDNIETPEALNGLTPRAGAHLLITTSWPRWQGRAEALELGKFSEAEAVEFLLKAAGRGEAAGAARLAEALDYLPLALDHAAAFCADGGDSFDAYAARLADWIREAPEGADYPRAVHATFSLAIEKAESINRADTGLSRQGTGSSPAARTVADAAQALRTPPRRRTFQGIE
jgi:hypothetical protein